MASTLATSTRARNHLLPCEYSPSAPSPSPPRTPVNAVPDTQQFTSPGFATAVLDPGSDPVIAARHRSKSEAQLLQSAYYPRGEIEAGPQNTASATHEQPYASIEDHGLTAALHRRSSRLGLSLVSNQSPTRSHFTRTTEPVRSRAREEGDHVDASDVTTRLRATTFSAHPWRSPSHSGSPPKSRHSTRPSSHVASHHAESEHPAAVECHPEWLLDVNLRSAMLQYTSERQGTTNGITSHVAQLNSFDAIGQTHSFADFKRAADDQCSDRSTDSFEVFDEPEKSTSERVRGLHARTDSGGFAGSSGAAHIIVSHSHVSKVNSTEHLPPVMRQGLSRRSKTTALTMTKTAAATVFDQPSRAKSAATKNEDIFGSHAVAPANVSCHSPSEAIESSRSGGTPNGEQLDCLLDYVAHSRRRAVTTVLSTDATPASLRLVSSPELSATPDCQGVFSPFPDSHTELLQGQYFDHIDHNCQPGSRTGHEAKDQQITLDEADPRAVAAALQYHRTSPSGATGRDLKKISCELCGALVLRWAILLPCNHRACSACCCSGVNQVSTTPPRRHVCAACQGVVTGLTLSLPAAEAAQAAAWSRGGDADPSPRPTAYTDPNLYPAPEPIHAHTASNRSDLTGRFPGVAEALLGINRPIRGTNDDVVAAALARQPIIPLHSEKPECTSTPQHTSSDRTSNTADLSITFSEDASFYGPQRSRHRPRTYTGGSHVDRCAKDTKCEAKRHVASEDQQEARNQLSSPSKAASARTPASDNQIRVEPLPDESHLIAVVRVDNIPWKTSYQDIVKWIPDPYELLPDPADVAQPVHVPIDVKTGKTANCAFIELKDEGSAKKLIRRRNNTKLCGRPVSLLLSNYEEVIGEVFPSVEHFPPGTPTRLLTYFTKWQLEQLIQLLRSGGPQLKSPLKPIEYIISLIQLVPDDLSPDQRDLLAEKALGVLKKGTQWLNSRVDGLFFALHRLIQASVNNRTFTRVQKDRIVEHVRQIPNIRVNTEAASTAKPVAGTAAAIHDITHSAMQGPATESAHHYRDQRTAHGPVPYHSHNDTAGFSFPPYSSFATSRDYVAPSMPFDHVKPAMVGSAPAFTPSTMTGIGAGAVHCDQWLLSDSYSQKSVHPCSADCDKSQGVIGDVSKRFWHGLDNNAGVGVSDGH